MVFGDREEDQRGRARVGRRVVVMVEHDARRFGDPGKRVRQEAPRGAREDERAGVGRLGAEEIADEGGGADDAHVERCVVGDEREAIGEREDLRQPLGEPWLAAHHRWGDAVDPDVEGLELVAALGRTH